MSRDETEFGIAWSATRARASAEQLAEWLGFAQALCDDADEVALRHFRRDIEITTKPDRTYVTAADTAIERMIRTQIGERYPEHGLVGEELGEEPGRSGRRRATAPGAGSPGAPSAGARWYIDPIDGTHNFIRGVPLFGTLLGLEVDGELQVGVMSAPALGQRWYASRGAGAWATGGPGNPGPRRIRASRVAAVADVQLLYGSPVEVEDSSRTPGFRSLLRDIWRDRGFGDFWGYALVAEGAAEAMVEVGVKTWDLAGPMVVVEEAGGRVTDLDGRRRFDGGDVLATNGILHDRLLRRLRASA